MAEHSNRTRLESIRNRHGLVLRLSVRPACKSAVGPRRPVCPLDLENSGQNSARTSKTPHRAGNANICANLRTPRTWSSVASALIAIHAAWLYYRSRDQPRRRFAALETSKGTTTSQPASPLDENERKPPNLGEGTASGRCCLTT